MEIITGYKGRAHVTAEQDRAVNQGIFGEGSYVLGIGQKMRAEIASNTEIRIYDGAISHQGCTAVIRKNAYDSVQIANGSQGMRRKDLVVARYTRDSGTGVEDLTWHVIQGTPAASNPAIPGEVIGDIQAGDTVADMKMFVVTMNGINMESVQSVFNVHEFTSDAGSVKYSGTIAANNVKAALDSVNGKVESAKSAIDVINSTKFSKIVRYNFSASLGSSSGTQKTIGLQTIEGYTPIGIVAWYVTGERASQVTFPNAYISGNRLVVYLKNNLSNTVSLTSASYFDVLYIKN